MADVETIMTRAQQDGTDPEEELRQVVSRAVLQGMDVGQALAELGQSEDRGGDGLDSKRSRTE